MFKHPNKAPGAIIIEGHVQGLSNTRSLGEKGIPVIVIDKVNCIARYSKYCKKFFLCPDFNSDEFILFLIKLCNNEDLNGWILVPSNDHAVKSISQNKSELERYYKIITDDYSIISKIYNKKKMLSIAENLSIPIPKTYYPHSLDLVNFNFAFPVIVKGIEGLTFFKTLHTKAFVCNGVYELKEALKRIQKSIGLDKVFIQEVIERNDENYVYSFTAFSVKGDIKTFWIGEKVREHPEKYGTATFARSVHLNDTLEYSRKLIKGLNYTGVCEVEFIFDLKDSTYKLIEINARTWLWVGLAKECGIDYVLYIYNYLNNISVSYPSEYKKNIGWMNFWTDLFFTLVASLKGKGKIKDLTSSFNKNTKQAVFSSHDLMPFLMMTIMLPYLFLKRT